MKSSMFSGPINWKAMHLEEAKRLFRKGQEAETKGDTTQANYYYENAAHQLSEFFITTEGGVSEPNLRAAESMKVELENRGFTCTPVEETHTMRK